MAFIGPSAIVISMGLLFWRHLGGFPIWTLSGLACYAVPADAEF